MVVATYCRWLKRKTRIDEKVSTILQNSDWHRRDKALFQEMLYGLIRRHSYLEWLIGRLNSRKIEIDDYVYAATAVALYQMLFLDRIPDYAAVDASVNLVKKRAGKSAGGWVNGILRSAGRERENFPEMLSEEKGSARRLSIEHSHPQWMVSRWRKQWTEEELINFLKWNNRRPGITLRINPNRTELKAVEAELTRLEIDYSKHPIDNNYLMIKSAGDISAFKLITDGSVSIQDVSQGQVSLLVAPEPGEVILDLCAAPGGKTTHLAELCPDCHIISTDKSLSRLKRLEENVKRGGYENIEIVPYGEILTSSRKYDAILIDAPCTGTGVLSRRPDLRWRRNASDIRKMAGVQSQLLRYASERLAEKGRIVYSTCSVESEENEDIVQSFLDARKSFTIVRADRFLSSKFVDQSGFLKITGPEIRADSVFAARLEKKPVNG